MKFKSLALLSGLLWMSGAALAEESLVTAIVTPLRQKEVVPVDNKQYKDECGSCHFAYQPGLLPAKSWEKLLNADALSKHFGDNAELDKDTLQVIHDYAIANAADKSYHKRSRKIAIATENVEAPLRITEVRYIKRKHHEIPDKMIKGNKDVKSLSYCDACHTQAAKGVFDADTVKIPNYPDWED
ncbi:MAG: diheme cytochrome c [Gallionellaceae bacterium]